MTAKDIRTIIDVSQDHTYTKPVSKPIPRTLEDKYQLQWIPDKFDGRDYKYSLTKQTAPNTVDLRRFCSPIEHQGTLGSCTGQAIAGAIELLNNRNGNYRDISRLFIYYYERLILGTVNYDSGAYIRDGIKATNHYGASLESFWPYDIKRFRHEPVIEARNDALKRKVTRYERINNLNECLDALANGYPIIMGFKVYTSFMSTNVAKTGMMPYPNTRREKLLGGHAVLLVGYDKRNKVFIARNSWGAGWGDKGYFYMPFSVVTNTSMSGDFWIIKSVNNP